MTSFHNEQAARPLVILQDTVDHVMTGSSQHVISMQLLQQTEGSMSGPYALT